MSIGLGSFLVALALVVAVGIGSAIAVIPDNGTYYACLIKKTGAIKVINYPKVQCTTGQRLIKWNAKGPAGPQGAQGPQGGQGAQGPAGPADWNAIPNIPAHLADGQVGWGEVKSKPAGVADGVDDVGYFGGIQVNGTVGVGANQYWFTFGYSPSSDTLWSAILTTVGGKVKLDVEVERGNDGNLTYWLRVTNTGAIATNYALRRTTFNVGIATAAKSGAKTKTPKWVKDVGIKRVKRSR